MDDSLHGTIFQGWAFTIVHSDDSMEALTGWCHVRRDSGDDDSTVRLSMRVLIDKGHGEMLPETLTLGTPFALIVQVGDRKNILRRCAVKARRIGTNLVGPSKGKMEVHIEAVGGRFEQFC
jgi:hypothetical protein